MKIFGQIVRTAVNIVALPIAVAKDVVTLGNVGNGRPYTVTAIKTLKDEAEEK